MHLQEGKEYLNRDGSKPDEDAKTRGQQKQLDEISEEEAPPKPKVPRTTTMAATAEVCGGTDPVTLDHFACV